MSRIGGFLFLMAGLGVLGMPALRGEPSEKNEVEAKPQATDHLGDPLPTGARLRLGTIRFRHGGTVTSVRYLPDGKTLMSYGNDQTLRYWDAVTGKELHAVAMQLGGGGFPYQSIDVQLRLQMAWQINAGMAGMGGRNNSWCLSPDGKLLATFEGANNIQLRDLSTDKVLRQIKLEDNAQSLYLSPDSKLVGTVVQHVTDQGMVESSIKLFDVATGKETRTLVGPKPEQEGQQRFMPYAVIFSPDSKLLAALGAEFNNNNRMRIWDLTRDREAHRLIEHSGTSNCFPVFSPDGKLLAEVSVNPITGGNAKVRLWDPVSGKQVRELGDMANGATAMVFSPDGKVVAAAEAANNQAVHLYDTATGKEIATLAGGGNPPGLLFSPDSKTVAVGSGDQMLHIYDARSGKDLHQIKGYMSFGGNFNGGDSQGLGTSVSFSPDGKHVAMTAGTVIRRWSVTTGKELPLPGAGHESSVMAVAVSPDGKTIATAGNEGLRLWNAATGQVGRRLPEPPKPGDDGPPAEEPNGIYAVAFAPDGKTLAASEVDNTIRLYDPATGKQLRELTGHESAASALLFSPTGKLLFSAGYDGRVYAWDVASGKQIRQFAGPVPGSEINPENPNRGGVAYLALSPDGATLVTSGDYGTRLCEVATGKVRRHLIKVAPLVNSGAPYAIAVRQLLDGGVAVNDQGSGLAFAPDGRTVASISGNTIYLWDTGRGKELRQLGGQGNSVRGVAFAPGGKVLAGSSEDGTIRFWDVATGTILAQVEGHRGGVGTIAFSADGQTLVSAGNDTTALVWDVKRCLETGKRPPEKLTAQTVSRLWERLADDDGEKAADALSDLIEHPELALPLLRDKLGPVPPTDKQRLAKLIANLEDDSFDVRKKANEVLEKLAELAEPALQARLADTPSLEVKQRIDRLLEKIQGPVVVADQARALRAVEVLEMIGTAEAIDLLEKLAKGTAESRITQAARESVQRLQQRNSGTP
jgi:WD40 repeat protein